MVVTRSSPTRAPDTALPAVKHPEAPLPGTRLEPHYAHCFGCGDRHPTGLHLHVTAGEGVAVTGRFAVTPDHQGAPGLAHGGLLAAAFDEALSSLMWLLRKPAVTARLETDFLRPVPVGATLHIHAWCVGVEGRKVYVRAAGRLNAPDGPLAVRASALFVQVDLEHFTSHGRTQELDAVREDPSLHSSPESFEVNP
jgi:acyl-coenzyme A thioesterase PaaI-like protein